MENAKRGIDSTDFIKAVESKLKDMETFNVESAKNHNAAVAYKKGYMDALNWVLELIEEKEETIPDPNYEPADLNVREWFYGCY